MTDDTDNMAQELIDGLAEQKREAELTKRGLIDETDVQYHGQRHNFSKSFLWDMENETPFLARNKVREEKPHFAIGHAAHIAILEPERLEEAVFCGPADRRGNKWKEAEDYATFSQKILLTEGDYRTALMIRDRADRVPHLRMMREGETLTEQSCYAADPETGLVLRCRPDLYNRKHRLMVDIKNMADAGKDAWEKNVGALGYHMQEAVYTDVWDKGASDLPVEGFWFLVFQKSDPVEVALYELDADTVAEGHARYRRAVKRTAECVANDEWPSYPSDIQTASLRRFDYKINPAPLQP